MKTYITIKDLKDGEIMISIISSFNQFFCLTPAKMGSWQMTVDYHKLDQLIAPLEVAMLHVVSSLEQINMDFGI